MIAAMNEAEPAVFALMDYWTFDGWFALKKRLLQIRRTEITQDSVPGYRTTVGCSDEWSSQRACHLLE